MRCRSLRSTASIPRRASEREDWPRPAGRAATRHRPPWTTEAAGLATRYWMTARTRTRFRSPVRNSSAPGSPPPRPPRRVPTFERRTSSVRTRSKRSMPERQAPVQARSPVGHDDPAEPAHHDPLAGPDHTPAGRRDQQAGRNQGEWQAHPPPHGFVPRVPGLGDAAVLAGPWSLRPRVLAWTAAQQLEQAGWTTRARPWPWDRESTRTIRACGAARRTSDRGHGPR